MTINFEIKGQLAKLLATEDLLIENKNVETAMFNVETRVLTLPMWEKATNSVYDMLVGHEVGHALYTPNDWSFEGKIPRQFVNVVEDARIEKLMKRKYAGLSKTFYNGYKELADQDFFQLEGEDISKMNLADRANLWFKIGNYVDIPIQRGEEMEIINMIADAETFADVILASEMLYKYCKEKKQEETKTDNHPEQPQGQGPSSQDGGETEMNQTNKEHGEDSEQTTGSEEEFEDDSNNDIEGSSQDDDDIKVETDNCLSSNLKNLIDSDKLGNEYIEKPDLNVDTVINTNEQVHKVITEFFNNYRGYEDVFNIADTYFTKYKRESQKEVNYLVKEFECKKSAASYSRSSVSRTGVLDCSKLHTYKFNEDLFKKVNVIPDGKNHGLIFVLDWSGSMCNTLLDTVKQLYNLIWFCKKVSIPFTVYAFTKEFNCITRDENNFTVHPEEHYERKEGLFAVDKNFSMMNLLTSDVSNRELNNQMKNIWRCVYSLRYYAEYDVPHQLALSGTPLNEAFLTLHNIIPQFKSQHNLEKVNCIVLTDGEANHLARHKTIKRPWDQDVYIGTKSLVPNRDYLRNRKTGKTYAVPYEWHRFTSIILQDLKDTFQEVNFIGIRVVESRQSGEFIRRYCNPSEVEDQIRNWKKTKTASINSAGYQKYFGIASTALSQDTSFDVNEDATKSQIKSAFAKSLNKKKMNKKILSEFIGLIV